MISSFDHRLAKDDYETYRIVVVTYLHRGGGEILLSAVSPFERVFVSEVVKG